MLRIFQFLLASPRYDNAISQSRGTLTGTPGQTDRAVKDTRRNLSVTRWAVSLCLAVLLPLSSTAHENDGPAASELHIREDAYWAELALDYPAFAKGDSSTHAPASSPSDYDNLGQWGPVIDWPHIPVSAANLPDGRILTWASNRVDAFPGGTEFTYAATWDPQTGAFSDVNHPNHDMFCAHQVVLEDGRIFVAGGRNHVRTTSVFDPATNTWTEIDDMNNGRWYPTAVANADGTVFIGIGSSGGRYPELWRPGLGWLTLGGVDLQEPILNYSSHYEQNWWPLFHVAPNGKIVHYGPTPEMHTIDVSGTGSITPVGPHNAGWYPKHGAATMFEEGRILVAGGAISGGNLASTDKAIIVDINGPTPLITPIASMHYPRKFQNGVVLPNGEVLIIGGNTSGTKFSDNGTILAAEMWNPQTQLWTELADMQVPRNYHSIALLLTDGRVLAAGGGLCGGCSANHSDGEVFSPPYLFNPDGSLATRPEITSVPNAVGFNATFNVQATPGISKFSLIKMSSTTHAINTDVRLVDVNFTETSAGNYQLTTHSNSNVLTPGPYMLFALNAQGVPSIAPVIQVTTGNRSPDIDNPGPQFDPLGADVNLPIQASDPDGDTLVYSATDLPSGLSINTSTGVITGQLDATNSHTVTVTVDDQNGGVHSAIFDWVVSAGGPSGNWLSTDVGNVSAAGSFVDNGGILTVQGSGADIWGSRDEFHFVYQALAGDGELTARVLSIEETHVWSRAGVMVRETLLAKSPYALMQITGDRGMAFQYRTVHGQAAEPTGSHDSVTSAPHWVRIVRTGSLLSGYHSTDGITWALRNTVNIDMASTVYIGLAVTSHDDGVLATAVFDNVSTGANNSDNSPPEIPTNLSAGALSFDSIGLSWNASLDIGGSGVARYDVYRDGGATPVGSTSSTDFVDTGLTENTAYSYQVTAVDLAGNESGLSDAAGATTPLAPVNNPPTITNPGDQTHVEGENVGIPVAASDPDGHTLTFGATGLPTGITIVETTGKLEGIALAAGVYNTQISVDDGHGGSDTASFVWTITPPVPDTTPPTTPADLVATTISESQIALNWSAAFDSGGSSLAGYNVYRDGSATPTAFVATAAFTDSGLDINTSYSYQVSAVDGAGNESGLSNSAGATTLSEPPAQSFQSTDIGVVDAAGSFSEVGGTFTVNGSGYDIWNNRDEFHYVYKTLDGDGELTARVVSLDNTHVWSRAGVMIRESLLAKSPFAMMQVTGERGIAFQYRTAFNASAAPSGSHDQVTTAPHWVRIVRSGDLISGYHSDDGVSWTLRDSVSITLPTSVHIGLAVTSHDDGVLATAVFDNVSDGTSVPDTTNPTTPAGLLATAVNSNTVDLSWIASTDSGGSGLSHYNVYRDGAGTPIGSTAGTTYTDTPLSENTQYSYEITAVDGAGNESGLSVAANATTPSSPLVVQPLSSPPAEAGTAINYSASASGSANLTYSWNFGDGTPDAPASVSASIGHVYAAAGRYVITLTVAGSDGQSVVTQFWQAVYAPLTANRPSASSSIAYEELATDNDRVWNVNPDNDTVTVFDTVGHTKVVEIPAGKEPRSIAIAPDGRVWVSNNGNATISIISSSTLNVVDTVTLPYASKPFGLAFDPLGNHAFVVLEATGQVLKLDPSSGAQIGNVDVGSNPRHVSISADGATLLVSRFVTPLLPNEDLGVPVTEIGGSQLGGEVLTVDAAGMLVQDTIVLRVSDRPDAEHSGRGVPNYLGPAVISPDGASAWVPSKQDNVMRGMFRDGQDLTHDSTVRAITSRIDLASNSEDYPARFDFDDGAVPSNASFGPYGSYLFTVLEGSRQVSVLEPLGNQELLRFQTGRAPQGIVISPDGSRAYVHNFMDRSISVHDVDNIVNEGGQSVSPVATYNTVASELLTAEVLLGKQLFYDALDPRLALQSYISCASCHNGGDQDGRVWDLTGFGEGLRNTINLDGAGGVNNGPLHWSANFDEVQDFEGQIRGLSGGSGLMDDADFFAGTRSEPLGDPKQGISADLDALAAYVNSLDTHQESPHRNGDGSMTADGSAGQTVFDVAQCAGCHFGDQFSDSGAGGGLHDVGTLKSGSGQRLNGPLTGLDTPTLRGIWASAPYLHDGSAATIGEAINAHTGVTLSAGDINLVVSYLQQVDASASAPTPLPDTTAPTDPSGLGAVAASHTQIDLSWTGSEDSGGSGLSEYRIYRNGGATPIATATTTTYSDTGLTGSTLYSYEVSAADNAGNESGLSNLASTATLPTPDTTAPSVPQNVVAAAVSQTQIDLSWTESSDTGGAGLAGYNVYRNGDATPIATVVAPAYGDSGLVVDTAYSYTVTAFDGAGNESAASVAVVESTLPPPPDTENPSTPTALAATAVSGSQVDLSWTASTDGGGSGLAGYNVYRDGDPTPIVTTTETSFNDASGLIENTLYSYQVTAIDGAGNESGLSNVATATTLSAILWQNTDVGVVSAAGSYSESNGILTVNGSGYDIWNNRDEFHFVYQELSGDGELTARVTSLDQTHVWSRAGVMIRESLLAKSPYALMQVTGSRGIAFQHRTSHGAGAGPSQSHDGQTSAPQWVRIVRSGDLITGYHSDDGVNWTLRDSVTIAMGGTAYIGLVVCSHDDGVLATATFTDVSLQ